jgi:tetratricopeptide (TPR) repeat protein
VDYDRLRELQAKFDENPRRYFAPLANEYRKGGQPKRAIEICRAHLAQMPGHMSGQIVYGQALFEAGEWEEAKTVFGRALSLDPENLIALRSLGDMALQAGDTAEARTWYARLLDADPKDSAVIELMSGIDTSSGATVSPEPEDVPAADRATADQQVPTVAEETAPSPAPEKTDIEVPSMSAESTPAEAPASMEAEPAGFERTALAETPGGAETPNAETPSGAEGLHGTEAVSAVPMGTEGLQGKPPVMALEGATSVRPDEEDVPDTWTPPPEIAVQKREESPPELRTSSPRAPEPFVNETMAQLYVQQGYLQLALKVYRQLSDARPNDQALKDRIAQLEAADSKEHPFERPAMRREEQSVERPAEPATPAAPRGPSIESPTPWTQPGSEEAPGFEISPIDSPATEPLRDRDSIESPAREEPRAEPEGIAARQPSVKEFFATLGRRRPPRVQGNSASRSGNSVPSEASASLATPAPGASLDAVFAGANVSPSDARAASRLAGAFSGATGGAARTPPTPPVPTPRVNPRLPQAQESEEDVAKFRAWLDGLTRE